MTSKVKINMKVCEKTTEVEVTDNGDGTYSIAVTSPCPNVQEFARTLEVLTMEDLVDKPNSRVFDRMRVTKMSANCLVPAGILSAAWVEAGLIARSRALGMGANEVRFLE
ncbi:MAG: hypothetical protein MIO90_06220 [Methanomassiliicoccales archaeon]|nr:hypothetical protein [Methanomassiliicoccales archaeon]